MAFKLSKTEIKQLDDSVVDIRKARTEAEDAIRVYNEIVQAAFGTLAEVLNTYNGKVVDARAVLEEIRDQADSDFDEKSEKWQDSDKGTATREWIDSLSEVIDNSLQDMAFDTNEVPELDASEILGEDDPAEALENIQKEPEA